MAIYNRALDQAAGDRDALAVERIQQQINDLTNEYNQKVNEENQRHANVAPSPGEDNTQFSLSYADATVENFEALVSRTGSGSGQTLFDVSGGRYVLQVQSSGDWTLKVYYKP